MTHCRIRLALPLLLAASASLAESTIDVISLQVMRASPDGFQPAATVVQFRVGGSDQRVLGLSEESSIDAWTDDTGADLLKPATPPDDSMGMGRVTSKVVNNIRHDRVSVGSDGDTITIMAVTPAIPAAGAGRLSLDGSLLLQVAGEGEQTVTLEDVTLEGGWGTDLEVNGKAMKCNLDSADGSNDETVSRFYCFSSELRPLRIIARGSEGEVLPADGRPNLIVVGPTEGLTLDIVMPIVEEQKVPLDLEIGLGLGG